MLIHSTLALCAGFLLDIILGDPPGWPHIVRGIGRLISWLEHFFYRLSNKLLGGILLTLMTILFCTALPILMYLIFFISAELFFILETLLCWQLLAIKSLKIESNKVYAALQANNLPRAREAVAMIVGRDTDKLDEAEVTRAAVESVAENTCDAVVAPLFYIILGGASLGCLYKAVNTLDSMIGYKNQKYLYFGCFAARLDDVFNFIPSRLSAILMIGAAGFSRLDVVNAFYIWKRDRFNHDSPNSAQTEAIAAGALQIRLGGKVSYFGQTFEKPYIGDDIRPIEAGDIRRSHQLLYITAVFMLILGLIVRGVFYVTV